MSFRADEASERGKQRAIEWFTGKLDQKVRSDSRAELEEIILMHGPVVDFYPSWHPVVWKDKADWASTPSPPWIEGLDHTVYMVNGFISCPYGSGDEIVRSVGKLEDDCGPSAHLHAEKLKFPLYDAKCTPVLVTVEWDEDRRTGDKFVPQRTAVGRMLERELPNWQRAEVGETWETMRSTFLGGPCGSRSSLFIHEETGSAMKRIWKALNESGLYGPIKVGRR